MVTGWYTDKSGKKYYFGKDGKAVTGKHKIKGTYYYFNQNGTVTHTGLNYSLSSDCALLMNADTGQIIYGKNENEKITKNDKDPIINMPIVVLTNEYSASASEIMTGALKDNEKATIIGTITYGKGVIQTIHTLADGSGLKITTNEYYTPKYYKINKVGIEPNIKVDVPEEYKNKTTIPEEKDTQLQKAIETLK